MSGLAAVTLFAALDEAALTEVGNACVWRIYERDEVIVSSGSACRGEIFFVVDGTVSAAFATADGTEITLLRHGAGGYFGILNLFGGHAPSYSAVATTAVTVAVMAAPAFDRLRRAHPLIGEALQRDLAVALGTMITHSPSALSDPRDLLCRHLIAISEPHPSVEGVATITALPSPTDLAAACALAPNEVAKLLETLESEGLLVVRAGITFLLDVGRMRSPS